MLVFVEGGKPEYPEKNPQGKVKTKKLNPCMVGIEPVPDHIVAGWAVTTGPSLLPKNLISLTLQNLPRVLMD